MEPKDSNNQPEAPVSEAPAPERDAADFPNVSDVSAELDQHRTQVKELEDQLLRRVAEFQNYRRRTEAELGQAAERGRGEVIAQMLDVLDDLHRSLGAAEEAEAGEQGGPAYQALKTGVDLVAKKFEDALGAFGVVLIEAVGQPFDEAVHEALMQQDAPDTEAGTVVGEIQRGYRLGDRVLRHARVIVAR